MPAPRPHRWLRIGLAAAVLAVAMAASTGVAAGSLEVVGATVDGASGTSTPPGGVLPAEVRTQVRLDRWASTRVEVGPDTRCVNHRDHFAGFFRRTFTEDLDVTAPGLGPSGGSGAHDASFTARGTDSCRGSRSNTLTLEKAVRVTAPGPNRDLAPRCGIDVMLVLDESGSIQTSGATGQVRASATAFLGALSGTGADVSIVEFNSRARHVIGYTAVTGASIAGVFTPYIDDTGGPGMPGYDPGAYPARERFTNWDDAFEKVHEANDAGPVADLVVFITDGDPTAYDGHTGRPVIGLVPGDAEALRRAAAEADSVKAQGSHVFALGVGAAMTTPASARRLTAVSGPHEYPDADFGEADYTLVKDFAGLADALRRIAVELCQSSLTVTKLVDEGDGNGYRAAAGWAFTATVTTSPGDFTWVTPPPSAPPTPRTATTDADGVATFQWRPENARASSSVVVTEDLPPGYEHVGTTCTENAPGQTAPRGFGGGGTGVIDTGEIGPEEYVRCTVFNRRLPGTIQIVKEAVPEDPQAFAFSGDLGAFSLVDGGPGTVPSRTFAVPPGTYTVTESATPGWSLASIACSGAGPTVSGSTVTIPLAAGQRIACTFRNPRADVPPPPPRPPPPPPPPPPVVTVPGDPSPPVTAGAGDPPAQPRQTRLRVVKRVPKVARVGQVVRFSLTVRNVGRVPATRVRLVDVPPAAMSLALARTGTRARISRGNAIWRFGTLRPGQRRTVRGTVLVRASGLGTKVNIAHAKAVNAELVTDTTRTRVLAQRRLEPAVTG